MDLTEDTSPSLPNLSPAMVQKSQKFNNDRPKPDRMNSEHEEIVLVSGNYSIFLLINLVKVLLMLIIL